MTDTEDPRHRWSTREDGKVCMGEHPKMGDCEWIDRDTAEAIVQARGARQSAHQAGPSGAERLLVWWTSQNECDVFDEYAFRQLPPYIRREFASRDGRPGHGRLWVPAEVEQLATGPIRITEGWHTALGAYLEKHCAGIVFGSSDLGSLARLPGTVTDLELRKVGFDG
jgi:hypothetical protein